MGKCYILNDALLKSKYISLANTHFFSKKDSWGNVITVVLFLLEKHIGFFFMMSFIHSFI